MGVAKTKDILADLLAFPSVSDRPNRAVIGYIAEHLGEAGAVVEIMEDESGHKANLFARFGAGPGGVLLSGHTDVVPALAEDWTSDPFEMRAENGRLYGRGTCDMKGFIAACLAMAPRFAAAAARGSGPFSFAFTYDEETGCLGARALAEVLATRDERPALAIIGEPTNMRVIDGHKGCDEYSVHFHGTAGHGSTPEAGVNALEFAARYVDKLLSLRAALKSRAPEASPFEPPETTINIGALNGGVAHNVIAAHARLDWEMRPVVPEDGEFVRSEMDDFVAETLLPEMQARAPQAHIETEVIGEVAGLVPMDTNAARDLMFRLTGANHTETVPFGTEAGIFQALGMDVVVCGPGSIEQAHQPDEYIEESELAACLDFLERLTA